MKIAISTINDYGNYGNRLQNYALQEVLASFGNDVTTIKNFSPSSRKQNFKNRINCITGNNLIIFVKRIKALFSRKKRLALQRELNFWNFTTNHIKETNFNISEMTTNFKFDKEFDCYVIGSDQVWNYSFPRFSVLDFVEYSNKPKISYAASFGVDEIPKDLYELYRFGLGTIDYISVREATGKSLIKKVVHRDSVVVLDPTLLLSKKDWMKVASKDTYSEKFIVVYFLGDILNEQWIYICNFAKIRNYKVKRIFSNDDKEMREAGPSQFINLFNNAEAIFTDSFHAVAFSIIFNKYFEAFGRTLNGISMNSRIDTLLGDLDLTDRWHSEDSVYRPINYLKVMELLDIRKRESMNFLKDSLKIVEGKIDG